MLQPAIILSFPGNQMAEDCELFARFGCEEVKGGRVVVGRVHVAKWGE